MSKRLAVLFILALLTWPVAAMELQGQIEHKETLSPVEARLQPGEIFDPKLIQEYVSTDGWRRIPNAMAGTWERGASDGIITNLQTGQRGFARGDRSYKELATIGYQMDDQGQIWDFPAARQIRSGEGRLKREIKLVKNRELIEMTEKGTTVRFVGIIVTVDKFTGRIERVIQKDEINTFSVITPNKMHLVSSGKAFTASGYPLAIEELQVNEKKIKDFEPVNYLDGVDLKESFANYRRKVQSSLAND